MDNKVVKEIIEANFTAVRAEMKADRDIFSLKLDQIIDYNKKQNGAISQNIKRIAEINRNTSFSQWVQRNPAWSIGISVIITALIAGTLHLTGLLDIIKLIL